jgi:hypothetical protein
MDRGQGRDPALRDRRRRVLNLETVAPAITASKWRLFGGALQK